MPCAWAFPARWSHSSRSPTSSPKWRSPASAATSTIGLVRDEGLEIGDWVLIHVGFAMSIIDEDEAAKAMDGLKLLGEQFDTEVADIAGSRIE